MSASASGSSSSSSSSSRPPFCARAAACISACRPHLSCSATEPRSRTACLMHPLKTTVIPFHAHVHTQTCTALLQAALGSAQKRTLQRVAPSARACARGACRAAAPPPPAAPARAGRSLAPPRTACLFSFYTLCLYFPSVQRGGAGMNTSHCPVTFPFLALAQGSCSTLQGGGLDPHALWPLR